MTALELIIDQYKLILDKKFTRIKRWVKDEEYSEKLAKERKEINRLQTSIKKGTTLPGFKTKFPSVLNEEVREYVNSMYYVKNRGRYEAIYFTTYSGEYAYTYTANTLNSAIFPYKKLESEALEKGMVHINYGDDEFIGYAVRGLARRIANRGEKVAYFDFSHGLYNKEQAVGAFLEAVRQAKEENIRLLIMYGILDQCASNSLPKEQLKEFLRSKPYGLEVVITGRDVPKYIIPYADYMSEATKLNPAANIPLKNSERKTAFIRAWYGDVTLRETAVYELYARAAASGKKVARIHFLGGGWASEDENPGIVVTNAMNTTKFTFQMTKKELDIAKSETCAVFERIAGLAKCGSIDYLLLDDVFDACAIDFLSVEKLTDFLRQIPAGFEIVATGYRIPEEAELLASNLCFTKNICHPYNRGIRVRKWIDY